MIPPYEYQLRQPADPATDIPLQQLGDRLSEIGVDWVDARPFFGPDTPSRDYFLAFDPMHLSPTGHRVLADVIARSIEAADAARRGRGPTKLPGR